VRKREVEIIPERAGWYASLVAVGGKARMENATQRHARIRCARRRKPIEMIQPCSVASFHAAYLHAPYDGTCYAWDPDNDRQRTDISTVNLPLQVSNRVFAAAGGNVRLSTQTR